MLKSRYPGLKWFIWIPLILISDQLSKWMIFKHLSFSEIVSVIPGFNLTFAQNHGIAFSLMNNKIGLTHIALVLFIVLITVLIAFWLAKTPTSDKVTGISFVFILGGALGNLCDRFSHGYVIDFIDLYIGSTHWYTFNLADSFITIGAVMMILSILFSSAQT